MSRYCAHGSFVKNPSTGVTQYLPCGKCEVCIHNKVTKIRLRVSVQKLVSKYCYFTTLTYNNLYLPKMKLVHDGGEDYHFHVFPRFVTCYRGSQARHGAYDIFFKCDPALVSEYYGRACLMYGYNYKQHKFYVRNTNLKDVFGCICHDDFACFVKRLKYYIYKLTGNYEKIHYYVVSEYGPWTFRPHFHIIFCFDSDLLAENFVRLVRESWKLGDTDTSADNGQSCDYVARYVNSYSRLPSFLRLGSSLSAPEGWSIRPRGRFSIGYGADIFFRSIGVRSPEFADKCIDGVRVPIDGKFFFIRPWRSLESSLFFRPPSSFRGDSSDLLPIARALYTYVYEGRSLTYLSRLFVDKVVSKDLDVNTLTIWRYMRSFDPDLLHTFEVDKKRAVDRVYVLFLGFRTFIDFRELHDCFLNYDKERRISDVGFYVSSPRPARLLYWLGQSLDYYAKKDYHAVRSAYQYVESSSLDVFDIYINPNIDVLRRYLRSGVYSSAAGRTHWLSELAVKHREVNDRNLIFMRHGCY